MKALRRRVLPMALSCGMLLGGSAFALELVAEPASEAGPALETAGQELQEPVAVAVPAPEKVIGRGLASWYGGQFHGRRTASGERFDMHALTAAHRTLPFGTVVRVRSLVNGKTVEVRINDRGPFIGRRVIDLSRAAAKALGLLDSGAGIKSVLLSLPGGGNRAESVGRR